MSTVTTLITKDTTSGVSNPFEVDEQVTVYAAGLDTADKVVFEMLLLTTPLGPDNCNCPPGAVMLPGVLDAIPLLCCGEEITLTRARPYVVIDAPLQQKLRVRLVQADPNTPLDTQRVWLRPTKTLNVNDRMRGCPCGTAQ